jgi:hypothetical protein
VVAGDLARESQGSDGVSGAKIRWKKRLVKFEAKKDGCDMIL